VNEPDKALSLLRWLQNEGRTVPCRTPVYFVLGASRRHDLLLSRSIFEESRRPTIFLIVVLFHGVIAILLTRETRLSLPSSTTPEELVLILLNQRGTSAHADGVGSRSAPVHSKVIKPRPQSDEHRPSFAQDAIPTVPPSGPSIDWRLEAELAAKDSISKAEREKTYRNLAGLSAEQLEWVRRNHMEPTTSPIEWNHPRYEVDRSTGLPVLWINDHCVMVTVMVFCAIGHIEANGDLFKHMREYLDERLTDPLP
jgi:hypothetical protein